tara:strand:- start:7 stop:870 length:864 start_codon:yes stop_codon:yes gene_type:complete
MSVLITGSSSYIGKNLIDFLERNKVDYIGIDLTKPYTNKCIKMSILDTKIGTKIKKKITSIIHLAAISSDQLSVKKPQLSYEVNILGSMNLIRFAKKRNINNFIFASTEWVYGTFKKNQIKSIKSKIYIEKLESTYAKTKAMMEKIIFDSELNYSILRFGIIYGKKKSNFSAVESLAEQVKKKKIISVFSKKTSRSFIHIDDIIRAIILSMSHKKKQILDIQGPSLVNLETIIKLSSKLLNKNIKILEKDKKKCSIRHINSEISNKILKFKPKVTIDKGIREILNVQ